MPTTCSASANCWSTKACKCCSPLGPIQNQNPQGKELWRLCVRASVTCFGEWEFAADRDESKGQLSYTVQRTWANFTIGADHESQHGVVSCAFHLRFRIWSILFTGR